MKLFLSDRKTEVSKLSPKTAKLKKFLDESKPGELFTAVQLLSIVDCGASTMTRAAWYLKDYFQSCSTKHGYICYWGSVATIKQLKKEVQKNAKRN